MDRSTHSIIRRIAFIGNYQPRQCGIATFTTDLCESIADEYKGTACIALPSMIPKKVMSIRRGCGLNWPRRILNRIAAPRIS